MLTRRSRVFIGPLAAFVLIAIGCGGTVTPDDASDRAHSALPTGLALVTESWPTDWSNAVIDLDELILGVMATEPRDAIPPIDEPVYESTDDAAEWLEDREPGAMVRVGGDVAFFPLSILTRHEIVNTEIGDVPVAVTFCPLCNTAIGFDRRVDGETLRFGVSGLLRNSDLVMWDDRTVSLWQQITGEALVGEYAGTRLDLVSTAIVSFGDFRREFPLGRSLSRETGYEISYGINRYEHYSDRITPMMPLADDLDRRYPALSRVVGVSVGGVDKAYPFELLVSERVINDMVGDVPVVVWWGSPDTADALDADVIAEADPIGTAIAYSPVADEMRLTFRAEGEAFVDGETGSTWSILGRAVAGPLTGEMLETVPHRNEFWFAWAAFFPDAAVYGE